MIVGKSTSVEFKSGMLLSKEMLEQLEYQTHLHEIQYSNYPDGILYGLDITVEDEKLFFSSGLIKYKDGYYYIHKPIDVFALLDSADENWENNTVHSAIVLEPSGIDTANEGVHSKCISARLVNQSDVNDRICLAEFQYHKAKRKWDIKNADLKSQLTTTGTVFSLLNTPYSLPGESVFSPYIYDLMKKCLESIESPTLDDRALLFTLCQNQLASFSVLKLWFGFKKIEVDFNSRADIINKFTRAISENRTQKVPDPINPPPNTIESSFGWGHRG